MKEMNRLALQDILEKNKGFIQSRFHVTRIGLFGSFVKGDNTPESDIDILVDFKKGHKDFFNYMRLKNYLQGVLGREVDLVMKSAVKPQLRENILRQTRYV